MAGARVLIVEDDPQVQQPLRAVLMKQGYEVILAGDGVEGLQMARAYQPDVLILDVMMPNMDGWTMLQQVRAMPEFALTPAIFLTALPLQDTMVQSFRMGGVDYIPKPFRFDDVVNRVAHAIGRKQQIESVLRARANASMPTAAPAQPTALKGSLDQVGLATLLSMMELEKRSGLMTLSRKQPPTVGVIALRDGRVVGADVPGDAALSGAHAIYDMLSWAHGEAEFQPQAVDLEDTVKASTTHLLMEGARLLDEQNRLTRAGG